MFPKIETLTSVKGHDSVEKFRKISSASHNTAYTKFHQNPSICSQILNGNKILTSIKGHNSVEKEQKIICNCPYLHFVNINACTKFYQNPSIGPQDIEHRQNFIKIHQLVHKILSIDEISTSIKGHNSVENERKILFNHLVNINAYTKSNRNSQINSQDIEPNKFLTSIKDISVKN